MRAQIMHRRHRRRSRSRSAGRRRLRHDVLDDAGDRVGGAAGRERHQHGDRPGRGSPATFRQGCRPRGRRRGSPRRERARTSWVLPGRRVLDAAVISSHGSLAGFHPFPGRPARRGARRATLRYRSPLTTPISGRDAMSGETERRTVLKAGAALAAASVLPAAQELNAGAHGLHSARPRLQQERRQGPAGAALSAGRPGGRFRRCCRCTAAWNNKDRTDGQNTALDLANSGIVVLSIDFRNAPEAQPSGLAAGHINYSVALAQGAGRRVRQQRRPGRRLRHLERRPAGAAPRDPARRSALSCAAAR